MLSEILKSFDFKKHAWQSLHYVHAHICSVCANSKYRTDIGTKTWQFIAKIAHYEILSNAGLNSHAMAKHMYMLHNHTQISSVIVCLRAMYHILQWASSKLHMSLLQGFHNTNKCIQSSYTRATTSCAGWISAAPWWISLRITAPNGILHMQLSASPGCERWERHHIKPCMLSARCSQCHLLGQLLRDDLINPVKMSIRTHVRTSTMKHNAATNQIVVFAKVDETFTTMWL